MPAGDTRPELLKWIAMKIAIEGWLSEQSGIDRETFSTLPLNERLAFVRERLDEETIAIWRVGVAAYGLYRKF